MFTFGILSDKSMKIAAHWYFRVVSKSTGFELFLKLALMHDKPVVFMLSYLT